MELQNARFARKPLAAILNGGAWTVMRVALFLDVVNTAAGFTGTPLLRFGLCSGTTDIPGDTTPTNAVGVAVGNTNWTYASQIYTPGFARPITYISGTLNASAGGITCPTINSSTIGGGNEGSMLFVTITKGSPNYTIDVWGRNSGSAVVTQADFDTQSIANTPTFSGHGDGIGNIAFSEGAGTLDAGFVYWDAAYLLRLHKWRVLRIA